MRSYKIYLSWLIEKLRKLRPKINKNFKNFTRRWPVFQF